MIGGVSYPLTYLSALGVIASVVALVTGLLARVEINESEGLLTGVGWALLGIVLGAVGVLIAVVAILIAVTGDGFRFYTYPYH